MVISHVSRNLSLVAVAVALLAAAAWGAVEWVLAGGFVPPPAEVFGFLGFSLIGALILSRRPGHVVGLVMWGIGVAWTLHATAATYGVAGLERGWPGAGTAAWFGTLWMVPALLTFVLLPLLFPDGHLPSRRWRFVLWAAGAALAAVVAAGFALPELLPGGIDPVANPAFVPALAPLGTPLTVLVDVALFVAVLGAPAGLVVRYRRSTGVQRQQMKLFLAAAVALPIGLLMSGVDALQAVAEQLATPLFLAVPAAIGVAVMRYRLYEIDRIVSRTVTYAFVVGFLVAVYGAGVVGIGALARAATGGGGGDLAVAASTLLVVALFRPLRDRLRTVVDRRFNRTRYDAQRIADSFGHRLRDEVQLEALSADLVGTAMAAMAPTHASAWVPPATRSPSLEG
jgi:hypothetical protein